MARSMGIQSVFRKGVAECLFARMKEILAIDEDKGPFDGRLRRHGGRSLQTPIPCRERPPWRSSFRVFRVFRGFLPESGHPQVTARLLVARFQIERDCQVLRQP
jgi:hypothetical protein